MRFLTCFLFCFSFFSLAGCDSATRETRKADSYKQSTAPAESVPQASNLASGDTSGGRSLRSQESLTAAKSARVERGLSEQRDSSTVSLASISTVYAATEALDRKIIRNAELTLETESPTEGLRKITAAAESHGGFVVTSEFKQNPVAPGARPTQNVTVIARVPASRFASALEQIRTAGEHVITEKVSGQDVSEEYLDLEARLRTKRALEAQFLEIMKQARKVQDALDVQNELADVRTEIERLEGRRRFLENQSALSTITTTLQMPQPIVVATTGGFGVSLKHTLGDAVDVAASIILFIIQAVIMLVPIALFAGLPAWLLWRVVRRRVLLRRVEPSPVPHD